MISVRKKEKNPNYKVVLTKRMPKRLHFRTNEDGRLGDIILLPYPPKAFASNPPSPRKYPGIHGYDVKWAPEMHATFMAWGPAFKQNYSIGSFENVHVYPLIADILGLKYDHKIDGKKKYHNLVIMPYDDWKYLLLKIRPELGL